MSQYRIRNNLAHTLYLPTRRDGLSPVKSGEIKTLDIFAPSSHRMRYLQQSGGITMEPAVNSPGGRFSPRLPAVHTRLTGAVPAIPGLLFLLGSDGAQLLGTDGALLYGAS